MTDTLELNVHDEPTGDPVGHFREMCRRGRDGYQHGYTTAALLALGRAIEVADRWGSRALDIGDEAAIQEWGRRKRWAEQLATFVQRQQSPEQMWRHSSGTLLRRRWHRGAIIVERLEADEDGCTWHDLTDAEVCPCGTPTEQFMERDNTLIRECPDCGLELYRRDP